MAQRGLIINGLRTSGAGSVKGIVMTAFDRAVTAAPGLIYDLDGSRLEDQGAPFIDRAGMLVRYLPVTTLDSRSRSVR